MIRLMPSALICVALAAFLGGCGKSVEVGSRDSDLICGPDQMGHWQFVQPDETRQRIADILFVVDTSASMDAERAKVADTIPAFIAQLPADTDLRVAVMLAHGTASSRSGRLYSPSLVPRILDSKTMSVATIQSNLRKMLRNVPGDVDEANGEAALVSLMRSVQTDRLAEIQAQGFYREGAALSVVFVTDENDICSPDPVAGAQGIEKTAYNRYCANAQVSSESVRSKVRALKGDAPMTLAGITHVDPARVPTEAGSEDSIGYGINELVQSSINGVLIDIADTSYSDGLSKLGGVVKTSLDLQTRFDLDASSFIVPGSVRVAVDGAPVIGRFDSSSNQVEIGASDAGKSRSVVQVSACLLPVEI